MTWRATLALLVAAGCGTAAPEKRIEATPPADEKPAPVNEKSVAAAPAVEPVAKPAPEFTLTDPDGASHALSDYRGKWVVLEWTNHGCPFVKKHYKSGNMQALQAKYTGKGVAWLSICSSAQGKEGWQTPADWKKTMARLSAAPTAMLLDADGKVGRAYGAKNTPTMLVIDPRGGIVYRGAIDDKRSADVADVATARNYVAEVLDAVLDGKPAPIAETAPYG